MWTTTKRIFKAGGINFWRNGVVSLSAVLIMTVTLMVVGLSLFAGAVLEHALGEVESRVDVNVYFVPEAAEDSILAIKTQIETMPEVLSVSYTSREDVLEQFRARFSGDYLLGQALDVVGENPFGGELAIQAQGPEYYESILQTLDSLARPDATGPSLVAKTNFSNNKIAIDRLHKVIEGAQTLGYSVIAFLALMSMLITLNTLRLAIYTAREEIAVMRLVGAENRYIRGPFVISGILYGLIAGAITLILLYPISSWLGQKTAYFFGSLNIRDYYIANLGEITLIIVGTGVVLGMVSSFVAVKRYLKI